MKKKILATTLGCVMAASVLLAGCSNNSATNNNATPTETTTNTPTETTETPTTSTTETPTIEDVDNSTLVKTEVVEGVLKVNVEKKDFTWASFREENTEVESVEEETTAVFTVKGLTAGESYLQVTGKNDTKQVSYVIYFNINEDLTIASDVNVEFLETDLTEIETGNDVEEVVVVEEDLQTLIDAALKEFGSNVPNSLATQPIDVNDADMMTYMFGAATFEGVQSAAVSEPMMSSIAFSMGALKFDTKENAENAVTELLKVAPTGKWVCVTPEEVKAKVVNDNYVMFIMCSKDTAEVFDGIEF